MTRAEGLEKALVFLHLFPPAILPKCLFGMEGKSVMPRRVIQDRPLLPWNSNAMVDAIVQKWLRQILRDESTNSGYSIMVRQLLVIFYADEALIASRCPHQLKEAMDILVCLFKRVDL